MESRENYGSAEERGFNTDFTEGVHATPGENGGDESLLASEFDGDFENDFAEDFENDFAEDFAEDSSTGSLQVGIGTEFSGTSDVHGAILTATQVSDTEIDLDLSVEDLATGMLAVDAEDLTTEDESDIQAMLETLHKVGYRGIDDLDYEMLERLLVREAEIAQVKLENQGMPTILLNYTKSLLQQLSESNATLQKSRSGQDLVYLRENFAYEFNNRVYSAIATIVYDAVLKGIDVKAEEVYNKLSTSGIIDLNDPDTQETLMSYLTQVVPVLVQREKLSKSSEEIVRKTRFRTARSLLREEWVQIQKFSEMPTEKVTYLREVEVSGDCLKAVCPLCGKPIRMTELPIRVLVVPPDRANEPLYYDVFLPVFCDECGGALTLTLGEYRRLAEVVKNSYKIKASNRSKQTLTNSAIQQESTLCDGACAIKISPNLNVLEECFPELITNHAEVDESSPVVTTTGASVPTVVTVDSTEFAEAVEVFYKKLRMLGAGADRTRDEWLEVRNGKTANGMANGVVDDFSQIREVVNENCNTSLITPKEVAAYMLSTLSLDYTTEKNKAIYSLLYYFQDNPILDSALDLSLQWDIEDYIRLVSELTADTILKVDKEKRGLLLELYDYLKALQGLEADYNKSKEERLVELLDMLPILLEYQEMLKKTRKTTNAFIETHMSAFGYCKLVNLSSAKLSLFDRFVSVDNLDLVDKISDLMLINGYAGEFFEVWQSFCVLPRKAVYEALMVSTSTVQAYSKIARYVGDLFDSCDAVGLDNHHFKVFIQPIEEEHSVLRKAYRAVREQNFYRFCKSIAEIPLDVDSHVSGHLTNQLRTMVARLPEFDDTVGKTEAEYFLSEFSSEELEQAGSELGMLTFGVWVPRRKENEGIKEFIERFKTMQLEDSFNWDNSWNVARKFSQVRLEALVVSAAAMLSSTEYSSFSTSMFVSRAIDLIFRSGSDALMQKFLNFSEELVNLVKVDTPFIDYSQLRLEWNRGYYGVLYSYYFTTVHKFNEGLVKEYDSALLYSDVGLVDAYSEFNKLNKVNELGSVLANKGSQNDDTDDTEAMINEVLMKCNYDPDFTRVLEVYS